jgi:hypothetical protein
VRLLAFGAGLAAVFVVAVFGASTVLPADPARGWHTSTTERSHAEETNRHHAPTATLSPQHSEAPHGGHSAAPAADPVRGLAVAKDGYQLESVAAPDRTGQDGTLSFRLTGPDGQPVTGYTTSHDKDLHLIVVRSDGSHFRHVHPIIDGAGTWSLPWRWTAAGSYRVFADFVPDATNEPLTLTSTVDVAGGLTPVALEADSTVATVAGYTVTLDGTPTAGKSAMLRFTVTRGGKPVTNLQPYLGAAGHLVALRGGDLAYLHVHPLDEPRAESGPDIAFIAETPTPGRYLLYLDFQVDGQVHTITFTTTATR